jgi:toxin ParE1/3/4
MADYALTRKAEKDLTEIYIFSYRQFGETKADAYLMALEERFSMLAAQPHLGRRIDHIRAGYLRYEHASHSIFYRTKSSGVVIVRVLHQRMDPKKRLAYTKSR